MPRCSHRITNLRDVACMAELNLVSASFGFGMEAAVFAKARSSQSALTTALNDLS
jgi:hypothetical protein